MILRRLWVLNNKILLALALLLTALVYLPSLNNGFVQDDDVLIVSNRFTHSWENFSKVFTKEYLNLSDHFNPRNVMGSGELSYRPVVTISYFFDYALWKTNPRGYHLTNLLLHLLNVSLVFVLGWQLLKNRYAAFFTALIFALHPVNTESVVVINFREDLLALLFIMIAFIFFIKKDASGGKNAVWPLLSHGAFFLALFSKEVAVVFPGLLMAYDYFFVFEQKGSRLLARAWSRYGGYGAILLFYLAIYMIGMSHLSDYVQGYRGGAFYTNLCLSLTVFAAYLRWLFWPVNIHVALTEPGYLLSGTALWFEALLSLGLVIGCLAGAFIFRKKMKEISFAIGWFLIALVPVSSIIPLPTMIAAHFLYIPMVGFSLGLATALWRFSAYQPSFVSADFFKKAARCTAVVLIGMYAGISFSRNSIWRDDFSLWRECVRIYPRNWQARWNLAGELKQRQRDFGATVREYKTAISLEPKIPALYLELGQLYAEHQSFGLAIENFQQALDLFPSWLPAYQHLGLVYFILGENDKAAEAFQKILAIDPDNQEAKKNLETIKSVAGKEKRTA